VAGEYAGPVLFEFPEVEPILQQTMMRAFAEPASQSVDELTRRAGQDTPERRAMIALYDRAADLPGRLRMFLEGCPAGLAAKRDRINCRQIVTRTLLALSTGIRLVSYWNLAPEVPGEMEPYQMMHLLFGKFVLLGYHGTVLTRRNPAADTFARLADQLTGATSVTKREHGYIFTVERDGRPPLLVAWDHRDTFDGEDQPPIPVRLPWTAPDATAIDAFGTTHHVEVHGGQLHTMLTDTPVFITIRSMKVESL
jgi:hypothetical protein